MSYLMRSGTIEDIDAITNLEAACFPKAEAADRHAFANRLSHYANHFLVVEDDRKIIAVVDGLVTDERDLNDYMYEDATLHNENGDWQMIFGVETHPDYQGKGIATMALQKYIDIAREQNRKGLVLTCKEHLIHFYNKLGFVNEGVSVSEHGNVTWYQMRLEL